MQRGRILARPGAWQNSSELSDHGGSPDDVGAQDYPDRARPFLVEEGLEFGLAAMTAVAAGD